MSEQAKLRLRSVRLDDALWERVTLAAADEGRSASQVVAAAVRAYVEGPAGNAKRPQERPGAPEAPADPRPASSAAPAPAPVAAVRPWRPVRASDEPRALEPIDQCPHPAAARRGGVGVVRHCGACGQPFGLTGIAG